MASMCADTPTAQDPLGMKRLALVVVRFCGDASIEASSIGLDHLIEDSVDVNR
jgi:hypothetical protein